MCFNVGLLTNLAYALLSHSYVHPLTAVQTYGISLSTPQYPLDQLRSNPSLVHFHPLLHPHPHPHPPLRKPKPQEERDRSLY
ncbi:hypothetical protein F5Y00DRAFT_172855 [Daldinia vernicosa]|uniref:uncharacterized protein n=1 Tax=Daldinia vernicosa TaxID=114800 RepID=UPI002008D3C3|nr:uncharacterized protein F5Y00DRAFT_172855 [Daldinia vernicosa]KAI0852434.1 hypothetical protein F5Y00DRAFT_172855 [Daldinia vernicosa]